MRTLLLTKCVCLAAQRVKRWLTCFSTGLVQKSESEFVFARKNWVVRIFAANVRLQEGPRPCILGHQVRPVRYTAIRSTPMTLSQNFTYISIFFLLLRCLFQPQISRIAGPPGTKPSVFNRSILTSTGLPDLDAAIGGEQASFERSLTIIHNVLYNNAYPFLPSPYKNGSHTRIVNILAFPLISEYPWVMQVALLLEVWCVSWRTHRPRGPLSSSSTIVSIHVHVYACMAVCHTHPISSAYMCRYIVYLHAYRYTFIHNQSTFSVHTLMHRCTHAYTRIRMHPPMLSSANQNRYVSVYACMLVCLYACMHVCMYACMHVCMYACMHVCMHERPYVYTK
jgi:hypothetical protein